MKQKWVIGLIGSVVLGWVLFLLFDSIHYEEFEGTNGSGYAWGLTFSTSGVIAGALLLLVFFSILLTRKRKQQPKNE
jgi:hypothetical protein